MSVAAEPQTGRTPTSEMIRYLAIRSNPFIVQLAEQGLQRNFFTGRAFNADTPQDIFGISADPQHVNAANLIRGLKDIDRLNIGQLFGARVSGHTETSRLGLARRFFGTSVV